MTQQIINAIQDGKTQVAVTISASDLKEVFASIIEERDSAIMARTVDEMKDEPTLTRDEVCRMLKTTKTTLWRWANDGYLKPTKVGAKSLYRKCDVERLLNQQNNNQ